MTNSSQINQNTTLAEVGCISCGGLSIGLTTYHIKKRIGKNGQNDIGDQKYIHRF
jgi:hypothetical protein